MNGFVYIFVFLDRIYRIYWIEFHQFIPEIYEYKSIILIIPFILSDLIQIFLDKLQNIVTDSLRWMAGHHFLGNASGLLQFLSL